MHLAIKWVVLSFIFSFLESFRSSSCLCCLFILFFGSNTRIKGSLFIVLCLFLLHAVIITLDKTAHERWFHQESAVSVDSSDFFTVGEYSAPVSIMEGAVELVVLFLMLSFLLLFLGLCSCLLGFLIIGIHLILSCLKFILFVFRLSNSVIIASSHIFLQFQIVVNTTDNVTIAQIPVSTIIFMHHAIELVESSFPISFFSSFLGFCNSSSSPLLFIGCLI